MGHNWKISTIGGFDQIKDSKIQYLIFLVEEKYRRDFYAHFPETKISNNHYDFIILVSPGASKEEKDLVGYLRGHIIWDWMKIETLWVSKRFRKSKVATNLLAEADLLAQETNLVGIQLTTWNKVLLPFYEKSGFSEHHVLNDHPRGHSMYLMIKKLSK